MVFESDSEKEDWDMSVERLETPEIDIVSIAVVEDDTSLAKTIVRNLQSLESEAIFQTVVFSDYVTASAALSEKSFQIVVLDLGIPKDKSISISSNLENGYRLIGEVSERTDAVILVFSSEPKEETFQRAFQLGADDIVEKSESVLYLAQKVSSIWQLLRRTKAAEKTMQAGFGERYKLGDWIFEIGSRFLVGRSEKPIKLSSMEHMFLGHLLRADEKTMSRDEIYAFVFQRTPLTHDRSLANLVASLRRKLPHEIEIISSRDGIYSLFAKSSIEKVT